MVSGMNQLEQRVREIDAGVRAIGEAAAASERAPVVRDLPVHSAR